VVEFWIQAFSSCKPFTREILTRKVREALGADKLQKAGLPVELILGADKDKT